MGVEAAAIAAEEAAAVATAQRSAESVDESGFPTASVSHLAGSTMVSDDETPQVERRKSKARRKPQGMKAEALAVSGDDGGDMEQGGLPRINSSWHKMTGDF